MSPLSRLSGRYRTRAITAALCVGVLACHLSAVKTSGQLVHLPPPGKKLKNGLRMIIDARWVGGNGYRPVRIRVMPWPPVANKADRRIRIQIRPNIWAWSNRVPEVHEEFVLPEGSTGMTVTMSVPQGESWDGMEVKVYEDGKQLEDLTTDNSMYISTRWYDWSEATPAMLFIDRDAPTIDQRLAMYQRFSGVGRNAARAGRPTFDLPDVSTVLSLIPALDNSVDYSVGGAVPEPTSRASDIEVLSIVHDHPKLEMLPFGELPQRWIDYSCFDMVFVSWTDLTALEQNHPKSFQALRDWAASGPTLCVYNLGAANLSDLETLLDLTPLQAAGDDPLRGWQAPSNSEFGKQYIDGQQNRMGGQRIIVRNGQTIVQSSPVETPKANTNTNKAKAQPPAEPPFATRPLGMGRVCAYEADPFPGSSVNWAWFFNSINGTSWRWYQRHGMSLSRENREYWNLLVPEVGSPPVTTFLVLITGFVVVIGPVNYLMLRRTRRLYLLLVTVPLGAALITGGLFSYAVISDGLGVKVRVRSFTHLDQRRGDAVSWSRQTYYASLAPSRGLAFPKDCVVYPILYQPDDGRGRSRRTRVVWDDQQVLAKGYLRSRDFSQMMVIRSTRTRKGLRVTEQGDTVSVKNELGGNVKHLLLVDSQGRGFWAAGSIANGATAQLRPRKKEQIRTSLQRIFVDAQPANPEGFDPRRYNDAYGFGRRYWYSNDVDRNYPPPSLSTSLLETNLRGSASLRNGLEPSTYLAVVENPPTVPLGVEKPKQVSSFHVVRGNW